MTTADPATEMTLVLRVKSYFDMTATQCKTEYSVLTQGERQWFRREFNKMELPTVMKKS